MKFLKPLIISSILITNFSCQKDSLIDNKTICKVNERKFVYDNDSGSNIFKYDSKNNLIEWTYNYITKNETLSATASIQYNSNGQIINIKSGEKNTININYTNEMITVQKLLPFPDNFLYLKEESWKLNSQNQIVQLNNFFRYEYNSQGQLTKIFNIAVKPEFLYSEFEYDDKINPFVNIKIEPSRFIDISNKQTLFFDYLPDKGQKGNITKSTIYNQNGSIANQKIYTYQYDTNDLPRSSTISSVSVKNNNTYIYNCDK